ncbi:tubby C-terminal-like domain-containing protein [Jimgerdemannia flammicorona]|uniref:Tubby C-terminal-like domain-containing protein n=1 Tax=Jimgerdemannia flammicorona TaxID=994334 RepID=A0A433PVV6_9FUNG|nr:tubby C-terminal-like domain-containing protein [Jimgerdemannia flammicorona]
MSTEHPPNDPAPPTDGDIDAAADDDDESQAEDAPVGPKPTTAIVTRPTPPTNFVLASSRMPEEDLVAFAMRPIPYGTKVLCQITRRRDGVDKLYPRYDMFIEDARLHTRTLMMSARKRKKSQTSHYVVSGRAFPRTRTEASASVLGRGTERECVLGKVRSNFLGTNFIVYSLGRNPFKDDAGTPPGKPSNEPLREELGAVVYDPNILGFKGPRKMTVVLHSMTRAGDRPEFRPSMESETLMSKFKGGDTRDLLVLHNKSPQWNEETQSFVLNFNGRVTQASVKNFQIVHDNDLDYIIMQFGRIDDDLFTMDFQYPMCPLQAFAIALSSFDAKLACE